ncbi:MAG: hypothetical protein J0I32_20170 [Sphingobacteriales bacterium]|nr:hypothetical protein [Sphingobacteriales bacterium]OJV98825.1 MAG: hypothetical protein BGO52_08635 [Sphingobacteriales bacterium 44-61]
MKKTMIMGLLLLFGIGSHAQNFNEWFKQKKTQKKYLLEQIAALKVYEGYIKDGYKIVSGGLDLIGDIKDGEFSLHKKYFSDLVTVNPQIKKYSRLAETISRQMEIIQISQQNMQRLKQSGMMKEEELLYVKRVFDRVIDQVTVLLDELVMLTSDGRLSLRDDERLERIAYLNQETRELYAFMTRFASEAKQLAASRYREALDSKRLGFYFGIIE